MIHALIHTLKQLFANPVEVYLSNATDLADLERRMRNIQTGSFRSY